MQIDFKRCFKLIYRSIFCDYYIKWNTENPDAFTNKYILKMMMKNK